MYIRKIILYRLTVLLSLLFLNGGCCGVRKGLSIQSKPYNSPVAIVARAPCSIAEEWAEKTINTASRPLFSGMTVRSTSPMRMNVYETEKEFREVSGCASLLKTKGMTVFSENQIHIVLNSKDWKENARVLRHELMHAWLHRQFDRLGTGSKNRTIPKWFHEGLAACFEEGADEQGSVGVNWGRLRHLKALIRSGRGSLLLPLLERTDSDCFSSHDYAVAWGMIWVFLQRDSNEPLREKLEAYLKARQEKGRRGGEPIELFETYMLGEGTTLEIWEAQWKKEILNIGRIPF